MKKGSVFLALTMLSLLFATTACNISSSGNTNKNNSSTSSEVSSGKESSSISIVEKKTITGITFEDGTFSYDGKSHSLQITGELPAGVTVSYTNNEKVNVGEYTVTATFDVDTEKYYPLSPMTAKMTIEKNNLNLSLNDATIIYDGKVHSLEIEDLPEGVEVRYLNNYKTEIGEYDVEAILMDTTGGYNIENDHLTAKMTICFPFEVKINEDSTASLMVADFSYDTLDIPSHVFYQYGSYPVKEILRNYDYDFDKYKVKVKKINIADGITYIGDGAFEDAYTLEEIVISNSVTEIGEEAFYDTRLKKVTLGTGLKTLGDYAFGKCINLEEVTLCNGIEVRI